MSEPRGVHRVFIVNEAGREPTVYPKVLAVGRGERVVFVVVGEKQKFQVRPQTNVFRSIAAGEEIPVELGSPPSCTVRQDVKPNSIHRYDVSSEAKESIDPILIIYESVSD